MDSNVAVPKAFILVPAADPGPFLGNVDESDKLFIMGCFPEQAVLQEKQLLLSVQFGVVYFGRPIHRRGVHKAPVLGNFLLYFYPHQVLSCPEVETVD